MILPVFVNFKEQGFWGVSIGSTLDRSSLLWWRERIKPNLWSPNEIRIHGNDIRLLFVTLWLPRNIRSFVKIYIVEWNIVILHFHSLTLFFLNLFPGIKMFFCPVLSYSQNEFWVNYTGSVFRISLRLSFYDNKHTKCVDVNLYCFVINSSRV